MPTTYLIRQNLLPPELEDELSEVDVSHAQAEGSEVREEKGVLGMVKDLFG